MSDYTITTDFGAKDSLPSGNAAKIIKGSEFTTEFTNIKTAVNTKADTAGDTFTGAVTFDAAVTNNAAVTINSTATITGDLTVDTNTLFVDVSEDKVGIGTTSPTRLLDVRKDSIGDVASFRGSDGARELVITSATTTNTGDTYTLNSNSVTGEIALATNSTERMRIDSSGRLLIGGTQVQTPSSIDNGIFIQSQTNNEVVGVNLYTNEASNNRRADFFLDDANGIYGMHSTASTGLPDFVVKSGTHERFRVTNAGNVGIGTTSPDEKLVVKGGTYAANQSGGMALQMGDEGGSHWKARFKIKSDGSGVPRTVISGVANSSGGSIDAINISNTGNVGIGTTSPSAMLDVELGATGTIAEFRGGDSDILQIKNENDLMVFDTRNTTSGLAFQMQGAEHMRIDTSGNVLVGKTSGGALNTAGIELRPNNLYATSDNSVPIYVNRKTTDGELVQFRKDSSTVGSISVTGSATAYNTSSDERLKENITDSADAGSKVDAIQIRQFDWKADGSHQDYGVIAQELVEVAPEAVHQPEDSEDMMGVDYSKLVPMLIKEVQSLRSRVTELENV